MSTEAPTAAVNPAKAMEGFIGNLQQAGMGEAAAAAAEKPATDIAPTPAPTPTPPPEKAPEIKPPEIKPVPTTVPPPENEEDKWPRSAKDWDAFKAKRKEREQQLSKERDEIKADRDRINGEIEKLKKSGPSPELDDLKKERDALSEQLRIVSVENHPKFKAYFENKTNAQIELAKRIVGAEKADKVSELLSLPDGAYKDAQVETFLAGLSGMQQSRFGSVLNSLSEIQSERHSEISRARENYEKMQNEQKQKADAQVQQYQKLFEDSIKQAQDTANGNPVYQTKAGDDVWNEGVNKRIEATKALLFGQTKPEQLVRAAMDAVAVPELLRQSAAQADTIKKLEAQVAELSKANPTVQGKQGEAGTDGSPVPIKLKPGTSPQEAVGSFIKGLQAAGNVQ